MESANSDDEQKKETAAVREIKGERKRIERGEKAEARRIEE